MTALLKASVNSSKKKMIYGIYKHGGLDTFIQNQLFLEIFILEQIVSLRFVWIFYLLFLF